MKPHVAPPVPFQSVARRFFVRAVAALAVVGLCAGTAAASEITFDFTGTVTSISPGLGGAFNTSQTLTGSFSFDPASTGTSCGTNCLDYGGIDELHPLTLTIGSMTYTADTSGIFLDRITADASVMYQAEWLANVAGPSVGGLPPGEFLIDLQPGVTTDALPLTPPSLSGLSFNGWGLWFQTPSDGLIRVGGQLTSFTVVDDTVPEPTTLALVLVGLFAVAILGRGLGANAEGLLGRFRDDTLRRT